MDHFVVLRKVADSYVVIADPALGDIRANWREVSEKFSGVALELKPGASFIKKPAPPRVRIRDLVGDLHGWWQAAGLVLMLSAALQAFVILSPLFLQWTIDQVLGGSDVQLLTLVGLAFLGVTILQSVVGFFRGLVVIRLSAQVSNQWLSNIFAHMLSLPVSFFEKRHLGDVISRMGSATHIQRTLTTSFVETLIDGGMAVLTLSMMLLYNWVLALITLAATLGYVLTRALIFRMYRNLVEGQLTASARLQSFLMESVRGVQTLKLTANEPFRKASFNNLLHHSISRDTAVARLDMGFTTLSGLIFGIERVIVIWVGASLALGASFSVGMLVAYLAYRELFSGRVTGLIGRWVEFRMLGLQGERLADIVLAEPDFAHAIYDIARRPEDNSIEVDNVSFRFTADEPWVVRHCSFKVAAGRSVAITGPSGCGKTTLVKLMLGILKPQEGSIRVGGCEISKIHPEVLRRFLGAVMQEDQLFAGTVADNIALGQGGGENIEDVVAAARLANIHDDIECMPMGYRTLIGDMGSSLSGGQKQRLVLAREFYRRPSVLFLDEATSHLDVAGEYMVNMAIGTLDMTRILVAHRPETIASAQEILSMHEGRVVNQSAQVARLKVNLHDE